MQVIHDKVAAPHGSPRLTRPRLLRVLGESLAACTATVVTGRAGTGKTLLAADFARRCGARTAWYKVEAPDGDLRVFFRYLVESVSRQRPGFGREALDHFLKSPGLEDVPTLAEAFLYELQECGGEPLLMVIDDLHQIYDAEWVVPFFSRLLPLLPREAHMLILGRSLPPTPAWRMRSKQMLCLVGEEELAFTPHEAAALFASYGLTARDARAALEQSGGRASTLDKAAKRMSGECAGARHVERAGRPWGRASRRVKLAPH